MTVLISTDGLFCRCITIVNGVFVRYNKRNTFVFIKGVFFSQLVCKIAIYIHVCICVIRFCNTLRENNSLVNDGKLYCILVKVTLKSLVHVSYPDACN